MKGKKQSKVIIMESIRKSKLFHREKMQPLKSNDYLKIGVIVGIITVPLLFGFVI